MRKIETADLDITIWNKDGKVVVQEMIKAPLASQREIDEMIKLIRGGTPAYLAAQIVVEDKSPYVTISHGMRGYFAVLMHWHIDGFWEPLQSGVGSFKTSEGAVEEAKIWAESEEVRYVE